MLPAQNATGNWVKVVQRIPVRIVAQLAHRSARASHRHERQCQRRYRQRPRCRRLGPTHDADSRCQPTHYAMAELPHAGPASTGRMITVLHHAGDGDAGARHHDRQRRASEHAGKPRRDAGSDHLGADLLHRRRRDHDAGDRLARRISFGRRDQSSSSRSPASLPHRCSAASPQIFRSWCFARILQGVFGAALVPLSQSVLLDINPREKHGQAMAIWGAGIMVGPIVGPILGGWLTDALRTGAGSSSSTFRSASSA